MKVNAVLHATPIESHFIKGVEVFIKREDMCTESPLPPVAKIRGLVELISNLRNDGITRVGVLDTRVSMVSQAVAYLGKDFDVHVFHSGEPSVYQVRAANMGAHLAQIQSGRHAIMRARVQSLCKEKGIALLPEGLICREALLAQRRVGQQVEEKYLKGTLVLSTGTGTILSGILSGFREIPQKVVAVSCGMSITKQNRRVHDMLNFLGEGSRFSRIVWPAVSWEYYDTASVQPPFPSNRYYDAKAWEWLSYHVEELEKPILFWNIGSE